MAGHAEPTIRRSALIGMLILLLASCAFFGDPVERQWNDRKALPSCGSVELNQGDRLEVVAAQEIECMRQALRAEAGAELSVTQPTTEGDPVRSHFRLTPSGRIEVYDDATDDRFSDQKWHFEACITPEWFEEVDCE